MENGKPEQSTVDSVLSKYGSGGMPKIDSTPKVQPKPVSVKPSQSVSTKPSQPVDTKSSQPTTVKLVNNNGGTKSATATPKLQGKQQEDYNSAYQVFKKLPIIWASIVGGLFGLFGLVLTIVLAESEPDLAFIGVLVMGAAVGLFFLVRFLVKVTISQKVVLTETAILQKKLLEKLLEK